VARAIPSRERDPPLPHLPDQFNLVTDDQGGTAPIADHRHDLHSRQSSGIYEALEAQARPGACTQVVALGHGSDYRQIECSRACVQAMRTDVGRPSSMGSMWNYGATYAGRLKQRKNGSNALRTDEIRSYQKEHVFIVMLQKHNTSSRMLLLRTRVDPYMLQRSKSSDRRPPSRSPAGGIHVRYLYPIQDPHLQALPLDLIHASTQEEAIRRPDVAPLRSALPGRGDLRRPGADR
jgi:hypothetical protein